MKTIITCLSVIIIVTSLHAQERLPIIDREWEAAYPDARLLLLEGAGQYPQIELPEEFFKIVRELLTD